MELRQLRAFVHVASTRHFGRAATELRITQPALTQRIQALERELGVQLLERSAREVQLTPAGQVLLPYATSLVQVESRALRDLADNVAGRAGSLRVAYLLHGDVGTQGKIVAEFRRRYQDVAVETTMASATDNVERLVSGEVDVAFTATMPMPPDVAVKSTGLSPMMLAIPARHPLAQLDRVPVRSLRGVPMIIWPRNWNPDFTASFRQWLARHIGEEPKIVAEEPADQAFETLVTSGGAVTMASSWRAAAAPVPGVAFRSMDPQPLIEHHLAYLRNDLSPKLKHLLTITDELVNSSQLGGAVEGELV